MTLVRTTTRQHMVKLFLAIFLLVSGISASNMVHAGLPLSAVGEGTTTIAPMLEKAMPGVVNISTLTHVRTKENPLFSDPFFRHFFNVPDHNFISFICIDFEQFVSFFIQCSDYLFPGSSSCIIAVLFKENVVPHYP